jgi:hypothetical protein
MSIALRHTLPLVILLSAAAPALAQSFVLLSDARSIRSAGNAQTFKELTDFNVDPPEVTTSTEIDTKASNPIVHSALGGTFDRADGLSLRTSDATLDGQGAQQSLASSTQLRAYLLADVFANADMRTVFGDNTQTLIEGQAGGSAASSLAWTFDLLLPTRVELRLASNLDSIRANGSFSLVGSTGFAWRDPFYVDPQGDVLYDFRVQFNLPAGTYALNADVAAGAFAAGSGASSDARTSMDFALTALAVVPEPPAALLLALGVLALGLRRRGGMAARPVDA